MENVICPHCGFGFNPANEEWRSVPSTVGDYWVSSLGRVKSYRRRKNGLVLQLVVGSHGYFVVFVATHGNIVPVHTLVAEAFLGPRPGNHQINHKNGIKTDNRPENLEYITAAENYRLAGVNGLMQRGEKRWNVRLTPEKVRYIRTSGKTGAELTRELGLRGRTVYDVRQGKTWKHIV